MIERFAHLLELRILSFMQAYNDAKCPALKHPVTCIPAKLMSSVDELVVPTAARSVRATVAKAAGNGHDTWRADLGPAVVKVALDVLFRKGCWSLVCVQEDVEVLRTSLTRVLACCLTCSLRHEGKL